MNPHRLSALLIAAGFLSAVAMAQPTYKTGTPKNQVISVGTAFDCDNSLYDPDVYKLSDGRLVLWGQGGAQLSCTRGIDSLYTATYKPTVDNWRVPAATDCPTLIGNVLCDHLANVDPDPGGPVGSPSAVQLNGKVYMAYVAGNADYERGRVQWAVGTDVNLAIYPSASSPLAIVMPSQNGKAACDRHGVGQVRLAYEAPYFYFIMFYTHQRDAGGGPYSTLAYRINYDSSPTNPSGLGATREIFTGGQWVPHNGTLIFDYDSPSGLPPWGNYDARGLEYGAEGDLKWDPARNRWIHIFTTWCRTRVQWQETTSLATGSWSAPLDVDVTTIRAKYPSTPFIGAGIWYGDATSDGVNNPRMWAFLPVHGGAACQLSPFTGLSVVMAPLDFVSAPTKYTLVVPRNGTGSGTVTSNPTGINCGDCCSQGYTSGTVVTLTATPAAGSTFAGWSGDGDCTDGIVTMNPSRTCTATFNLSDTVWLEDNTAKNSTTLADNEVWNWISFSVPPGPYSGTYAHQSGLYSGFHQHYFFDSPQTLTVNPGDRLFTYVYLDPSNPPSQVMLQWKDSTWEHRAYWGANLIAFGTDGTTSRRSMGALPPAGQWVRLEVAASAVGLEGQTINGMAFTLFGGRATWDRAGKTP